MVEFEKKSRQQEAREVSGAASSAVMDDGQDMDSDDEVYAMARQAGAADKSKIPTLRDTIEELNRIDHSSIEYPPFERCFYDEDPEIFAMSDPEVSALRFKLDLTAKGEDVPRPIKSFAHLSFPPEITKDISKHGYTEPTPIQAQALPAALSGRDIIGIAKTGSGKTAAFILPMLVHILDQDYLAEGDGPIGVVMAPTRELCQQIFTEAKKFSKSAGVAVAGAYGGASKNEQVCDVYGAPFFSERLSPFCFTQWRQKKRLESSSCHGSTRSKFQRRSLILNPHWLLLCLRILLR
jgi:ATP-dependent RNA helicase DDX42